MSIAVNATIRPSRMLLTMVGAACACIVFIAAAVAFGSGYLSGTLRMALAIFLLLLATAAFFRFFLIRKTFQLDVSGIGQIRLKETIAVEMVASHPDGQDDGLSTVELMADSTFWPNLLLLRLRTADARIVTLPVFQDSVTDEEFRALSVACRWITARRGQNELTHHK